VAERTLQLEQEHLHWQTTERQVHPGTQRFEVEAVIDVAEFGSASDYCWEGNKIMPTPRLIS
jgi:hypothetical protein